MCKAQLRSEWQELGPWRFRVDLPSSQKQLQTKINLKPEDLGDFLVGAILSVRPKCSHRCVSLKETPLKLVQILKHTTQNSTEQTAMRTKWFKDIAYKHPVLTLYE